MPRQQIGAPVALILIVSGITLMYYILHSHGWSWNGPVPLAETFRNLSVSTRTLVVLGLVSTAWAPGRCSIACCGKNNQLTGTGEVPTASCGSPGSWCSTENAMNKGDSSAAARQIYKAHSIHR